MASGYTDFLAHPTFTQLGIAAASVLSSGVVAPTKTAKALDYEVPTTIQALELALTNITDPTLVELYYSVDGVLTGNGVISNWYSEFYFARDVIKLRCVWYDPIDAFFAFDLDMPLAVYNQFTLNILNNSAVYVGYTLEALTYPGLR